MASQLTQLPRVLPSEQRASDRATFDQGPLSQICHPEHSSSPAQLGCVEPVAPGFDYADHVAPLLQAEAAAVWHLPSTHCAVWQGRRRQGSRLEWRIRAARRCRWRCRLPHRRRQLCQRRS